MSKSSAASELISGIEAIRQLTGSRRRLDLCRRPTPIHALPRLSEHLGVSVYCKRDDLTGFGFGGNKIRKLEYLVRDAVDSGADTLVTCGSNQSNWCRMTAVAGAVAGLDVCLVLGGGKPDALTGNLLLDHMVGADMHHFDTDDDDDGDGTLDINDDFPKDPAEDTDTDNDGTGDNADDDDDGGGGAVAGLAGAAFEPGAISGEHGADGGGSDCVAVVAAGGVASDVDDFLAGADGAGGPGGGGMGDTGGDVDRPGSAVRAGGPGAGDGAVRGDGVRGGVGGGVGGSGVGAGDGAGGVAAGRGVGIDGKPGAVAQKLRRAYRQRAGAPLP